MGNVKEKQEKKRQRLLETAFELFTSKGINETTIQDITREADVAKGTFYLYFKDKYDLIDKLRRKKAAKLFEDAIHYSRQQEFKNFTEQFLLIIDYTIVELNRHPELLKFIYKNLSLGAQYIELEDDKKENQTISIFELFKQRVEEEKLPIKDPDTVFFMIIELVGGTSYSSILFDIPAPIETIKPHLSEAIRKLLSR